MMIICYASDIIGYDIRTPWPSYAPLHMKLYVDSIDYRVW